MESDWDLVANKSGPTRLGFCLMLKFFEIEARFPEFIEEFPQPAVEYVAELVKVSAAELAKYDLAGAKRHRKQIREALGFRPATLPDEEELTAWLAAEVCPVELLEDRQREALWSSAGRGRSSRRAGPGSRRSWSPRGAGGRRCSAPGPSSAWVARARSGCWRWSRRTTRAAPPCWPRSSVTRARSGWTRY
ncbi:DUF4158 domain-containing protein [Streptomyces sp. NPDC086549]|uniref:DUF4158 domain-containing protein n=1 Tax=Streptomyces sp. NPDC086549 TaxID=3365752 RepID=UPI0038293CB3